MKLLRRCFGLLLLLVVAGLGTLHLRIEYLVNQPVPTTRPADSSVADQYYFAYGTNMPTRYFYNVRGVLPAQSAPGIIKGFKVSFLAPGLNALEPAFAYLLKADTHKAYGVLHRLSRQDLDKVRASEGSDYEWVTLPVEMENGQVVSAQTLLRLSQGTAGVPSRRYREILVEGAAEHGLPAEYIAEMQNSPSTYVPVVSELMGDIVHTVVMARSGKCTSLLVC